MDRNMNDYKEMQEKMRQMIDQGKNCVREVTKYKDLESLQKEEEVEEQKEEKPNVL